MVSSGKVGINDIYHAQLSLTQSVPSHQGVLVGYDMDALVFVD